MATTQVVQVVTTIEGREVADELARGAVEARVAACAQVDGPIKSTYWWQGAVQAAEEWRITFKTTAAAYSKLEAFLDEHHPYDVPEILCTSVKAGNSAYLSWVDDETVSG